MFTGLVEATGTITKIVEMQTSPSEPTDGSTDGSTTFIEQARYEISIPFAKELSLGDSVAINGCCLTVAELYIPAEDSEEAQAPAGDFVGVQAPTAAFDLLQQTLTVTSLGTLTVGSTVNLERALLPTQRLGGHFVQGHVDGIGELLDLSKHGQDHRLEISLPPEIHKYCIDKGSIAIDGISLTIAELIEPADDCEGAQASAVFWITPHTFQETHLHSIKPGAKINLEADLLAKYTEKLLAT